VANGITAPAEGATVSGTTEVKGYANDPAFKKWQLDVLPGGDGAAVFVATGETGEFTYCWTPPPPDGARLRRRARR
jgi:hypothetical protein